METNISERLLEAMNDLEINATELVRRSGVSKNSISQYIHGKNVPNNNTATLLAKALHVDPLWIMGYDVPKNYLEKIALESVENDFINSLLKNDLLKKLLIAGSEAPDEAVRFAILALEAAAKEKK